MQLLTVTTAFLLAVGPAFRAVGQVPADTYRSGYERGIAHEWIVVKPDSSILLHEVSELVLLNHPSSAKSAVSGEIVQSGSTISIHYEAVLFDTDALAARDDWEEPPEVYAARALETYQLTRSQLIADTLAGTTVLAWSRSDVESCRSASPLDPVTGVLSSLDWEACRRVLVPASVDKLRLPPRRGVIPCEVPEGVFFPTMPEREAWYSRHLAAAGETPLCALAPGGEIYRFTWLRTFHPPVVITVGSQNEGYWLRATTLSGQGGYEPGEVVRRGARELDREQWSAITRLVHALSFWSDDTADIGATWGTDGSEWIVEGLREEEFRAISRHMPQRGALYDLGVLLIELADVMPDDPRDFY